MKFISTILLISLLSCTAGITMKPVKLDNLFHDGNSKVWMINKMFVNNENLTAPNIANREVMIFYVDGSVQYIPLKNLGAQSGNLGDYTLDSDNKALTIYFKNSIWDFNFKKIKEDTLFMTSTKESDRNIMLELIPLPKISH